MKRSPSLHRSSTLDATSCCQPLRSQPSSWLAWRRPHTMRELPTMEVQIPRLLGRTLLHWRRPPVGMLFQIKNKLSSHIGVALANHSQAIGPTSPECGVCAFGMHCGGPDLPRDGGTGAVSRTVSGCAGPTCRMEQRHLHKLSSCTAANSNVAFGTERSWWCAHADAQRNNSNHALCIASRCPVL